MKCPHCAAENKDAAKFCAKCGQSLAAPSAPSEKPCPDCGHACKPDAKFCPKCGHNFSAVAPVDKTVARPVEAPAAVPPTDMLPCPHCGAGLKIGTKFCGKCGKSTIAAKQDEVLAAPAAVKEIASPVTNVTTEPPKIARVEEGISMPPLPESIVEKTIKPFAPAPEIKAPQPVAQPRPASIKIEPATSAPPQLSVPEGAKNRPTGLIAAIVILLLCAMGGGAYWWFGAKKAAPSPVAAAVNVQPTTAANPPASSVDAVSAPIVAPVAPPAPSPVVPPVAKPEIPPVAQPVAPSPPVAHSAKKQKAPAHKGAETNDDRKLLNAIDQYMDKQK